MTKIQTKTCAFCFKAFHWRGHYKHELACGKSGIGRPRSSERPEKSKRPRSQCKFCHMLFVRDYGFKKHEENCAKFHTYIKSGKCVFCNKSPNQIFAHLKTEHMELINKVEVQDPDPKASLQEESRKLDESFNEGRNENEEETINPEVEANPDPEESRKIDEGFNEGNNGNEIKIVEVKSLSQPMKTSESSTKANKEQSMPLKNPVEILMNSSSSSSGFFSEVSGGSGGVTQDTDGEVSRVYPCPLCDKKNKKYFLSKQFALNHVSIKHNISSEIFSQLGFEFKSIHL